MWSRRHRGRGLGRLTARPSPVNVPGNPGLRQAMTLCYCRAMDQRLRDRASIIIAGVAVILSLVVVLFARFDPGVVLTTSGPYVIVDDAAPVASRPSTACARAWSSWSSRA